MYELKPWTLTCEVMGLLNKRQNILPIGQNIFGRLDNLNHFDDCRNIESIL